MTRKTHIGGEWNSFQNSSRRLCCVFIANTTPLKNPALLFFWLLPLVPQQHLAPPLPIIPVQIPLRARVPMLVVDGLWLMVHCPRRFQPLSCNFISLVCELLVVWGYAVRLPTTCSGCVGDVGGPHHSSIGLRPLPCSTLVCSLSPLGAH